jgi:hypothetical protein
MRGYRVANVKFTPLDYQAGPTPTTIKDYPMKLILSLLGVVLLIVAAVYFLMPADQLPSFMPGHEAGVMRLHTKHGIVAGVAGVVLLAAGWWMGRR